MLQTLLDNIINKTTLKHIIALTLVLLSPALFSGLMGDDLFHYALLNGAVNFPQPNDISLFNLFSFINDDPVRRAQLQDIGIMSWWVSPSFEWNFFRPIAELTHYIDYVWLKGAEWLMHLHSIMYFVIIILLVYKLGQCLLDDQRLVLLITALYALSATHGLTVAWLCNRNALLAMVFSLASLIAFIQSQQLNKNTRLHYLLSLAFLPLALLSGEIALSLGGFLLGYILCLSTKPVFKSLLWLLPHLAIVVIWFVIYNKAGFGAHGNTLFYINPAEHPISYLSLLLERIPLISLSLLLALPADIIGHTSFTIPLIVLALLLIGVIAYFLKNSAHKKVAMAFSIAAFIAILPIACSPPQSRNLIFVSLSSAVIIGIIMQQLFQSGAKVPLFILVILHLILSPLLLLPSSYMPQIFSASGERRAATLEVMPNEKVIVFNANMMEMTYLAAHRFKQGLPIPQRIWNLTGAESQYTIKKMDDHRLRLISDSHFLSSGDLLVRNIAAEPFHAGDTIAMNGLIIHIIAVNAAGYPAIFDAIFTETLDNYTLMQWRSSGYVRLPPLSYDHKNE